MATEKELTIEQLRDNYFKVKFRAEPSAEKSDILDAAEQYITALERHNHRMAVSLAEHQVVKFPRIKDLPSSEQREFSKWLMGQTCPYLKGVPYEEQDAYYQSDYDAWKASLRGEPVSWD